MEKLNKICRFFVFLAALDVLAGNLSTVRRDLRLQTWKPTERAKREPWRLAGVICANDECIGEHQYSPESADQDRGELIYTGGESRGVTPKA
ncbi:hypothetical protein E2542_SST26106 [Spatholobus suberectus]|nr:hypothetical protein E2542_SST26106 [Spatholobus suberectus]